MLEKEDKKEKQNVNNENSKYFEEIKFKKQEGALKTREQDGNINLVNKKIFIKLIGESFSKYK